MIGLYFFGLLLSILVMKNETIMNTVKGNIFIINLLKDSFKKMENKSKKHS